MDSWGSPPILPSYGDNMINPKIKGLLSATLLLVFMVVAVSGFFLFLSPKGKVAKEVGWQMIGISKEGWAKIHTISGFLMVILVLIHFVLNLEMLKAELTQG
jgi:ABC-type Fe3+-siderophore transport system permease subunit